METYLKDLAKRVVRAFLTAVLPLLGLGDGVLDVFAIDWKAALLAGATAAGFTVVKGVIGRFLGDKTVAKVTRSL